MSRRARLLRALDRRHRRAERLPTPGADVTDVSAAVGLASARHDVRRAASVRRWRCEGAQRVRDGEALARRVAGRS